MRVLGINGLGLIPTFDDGACYACPTHKEHNSILARKFNRHVLKIHQSIVSSEPSQQNTNIVGTNSKSYLLPEAKVDIDRVILHQITTICSNDNMIVVPKHIYPTLWLYVGVYLILTVDNKHLKDKVPHGNGLICRVASMKLKDSVSSFQ